MKKALYAVSAAVAAVAIPAVARAEAFTAPTISTTEIWTMGGAVLTAIGAIWGIKKLIKLGNKS